ncbi:DUF3800 domain-containing protein [Proteinivorax tanatarense]|uniref:DUF3800 domain-containing protein n=1 Tax=Proteinivorax tanatarense TaxID=1260629 RepID=A0AAU7VM72_9FIRM
MIFYLDECFNTGNNWNDKSQPYFTYGGWIISEDNLEKANSIVKSFAEKHQGELKSKSFASHKGIKKVINLSKELMSKSNAVPYFVCFEKNYLIACKVVELFFDCQTNCKVNGYLTFPNEFEYFKIISNTEGINVSYENAKKYLPPIKMTKKALADIISTDQRLCTYIGDIINDENIHSECIYNIIEKLESLFYKQGFEQISNIFKIENFDAKKIYEELIGEELKDTTGIKVSKKSILVQPSLYEMIQNLRNHYRNLRLVVDTLGIQDSQFAEISERLEVPIEVVEESENEFMILASDLLVGHVARLVKNIIDNSNFVGESDIELLKSTITEKNSVFEHQSSIWHLKFSEKSGKKILEKLGYQLNDNGTNQILKDSFHLFRK